MVRTKRELVTHTFKGGRFDDHGVDLDVLPDLVAYKTLLVETAKELWRRKNPDRQRLPKNFEESVSIKFYEVRKGSAALPLFREVETEDQLSFLDSQRDELDEAVDLIADTVDAAGQDRTLPQSLPSNVVPLFENYGKTLRPDEWIEQLPAKRISAVRYSPVVRERLTRWTQSSYEDAVDVIGAVTMARVSRPRMCITLDDGREVEAAFRPEDEGIITTALKEHATAKVRVEGRAQFLAGGQIQRIVLVERVTLLPVGEMPFDSSAKPIWKVFAEIVSEIPEAELRKLPTDTAENHDHYIYGTPKGRQ
jgi:hypothetical protein